MIMELKQHQKDDYLNHLVALSEPDKVSRFSGRVSDSTIAAYVENINWTTDIVLGIYDHELNIVGAAHVAILGDTAEIGISVLENSRGHGYGSSLFEVAVIKARNRNATKIWTTCSRTNNKMIKLATKHGLQLVSSISDVEGHLEASEKTPESLFIEQTSDGLALVDYYSKFQFKAMSEIWKPILTMTSVYGGEH